MKSRCPVCSEFVYFSLDREYTNSDKIISCGNCKEKLSYKYHRLHIYDEKKEKYQ